jgi:hypothetical protein
LVTVVAGSDPAQDIDVCLCVSVFLYRLWTEAFVAADHPFREVVPSVLTRLRNLKRRPYVSLMNYRK